MSKAAFVAAGAAIVALNMAASLCADGRRPAVTVMIRNDANVPPQMLDAARDAVATVYRAAGVEIRWSGPQPAATLALIARDQARKLRRPPEIIGFALVGRARRGTMAYIFVHRVAELSARYRVAGSAVLGAVIAHELGHLLLPFDAHSESGVMRPQLDGGDFGKANRGELLFTPGQAVQVRAAVEARTGLAH